MRFFRRTRSVALKPSHHSLSCHFVIAFVKGSVDQIQTVTMATRAAARYISRRLSSSGKVLSEEEKAAENVYIKKVEQEKLEKLARKGPQAGETPATGTGGSAGEAKQASGGQDSSTAKTSTDKDRNYAVLAGAITAAAALGWYLKSRSKKQEEVQD